MEPARADNESQHTRRALLELTQQLLREVHPQRRADQIVALDSSFERDIGLDSLARVELIARVEKQFGLALPERTFAEAETPRDLLRALRGAKALPLSDASATQQAAHLAPDAPLAPQTLIEALDWHVVDHPDRPHIQLYQDQRQRCCISYRQPTVRGGWRSPRPAAARPAGRRAGGASCCPPAPITSTVSSAS